MVRIGLRLITLAAVAAGVVTACNSDGGSNGNAAPTTLASRESTTTSRGQEAEVLAAYRRFWNVYLDASDPMNPEDPRLPEVATGDELQQVTGGFLARKSAGEVFRGSIDLNPEVVELKLDRATLRDCHDSKIAIHDAETGAVKEPGGGVALVTVTMTREGDTWKVASIKREGAECEA